MPTLIVDRDGDGLRLDRYLRKALPQMPSGHIFKLLRKRKVRVNGKRARAELRLADGDEVLVHMDAERFAEDTRRPVGRATSLDFSIVFEDDHLLVVNKPPFLPVHPGAGHADNSLIDQIHAYLEVSERPGAFRPSLAHRLDRDTSGLVMIGKTAECLRALAEALKRSELAKKYLALVKGKPPKQKGQWDMDVKRRDIPGASRADKGKRQDKPGQTAYRVAVSHNLSLGREKVLLSLLVLKLLTGRTHQIRSHLEQAGLPLLGDPRYGDRELNKKLRERFALKRQFLHAYRLTLTHPISGRKLNLHAPYPDDLQPLVDHLNLGVPAF